MVLPGLAFVPHSQHVFFVPESAVWSVLAPFAALAAWWSTRQQARAAWPPYVLPVFGALAGAWVLAAAFALRWDLAAQSVGEWLAYAGIAFAVWRLATTRARRSALIAILLAYGLLSALYAFIQVAGLDPVPWSTGFGGRASAFFGNPNFLGGHLALLLPLSLALALDRRSEAARWRWMPWAFVALLGAALLLTQTRGAWIGAAVGCALVLVLAQRWLGALLARNKRPLLVMAALTALGLAAFFAARPDAATRLKESWKSEDSELTRRFYLMKKASQLASLKPLLGVGPGNFRIQFARVQVTGLLPAQFQQPYVVSEHAHNDFLQMAAEAGVPAALLWAALMGLVLVGLLRGVQGGGSGAAPTRHRDALLVLGVLGGLVALLVHGLANFPFLIQPTQAAAWALAALALRALARPAAKASDEGLIDAPLAVPLAPPSALVAPWGVRVQGALLALGLLAAAANTVRQGQRLSSDRLWWVGQGELQLQHPEQASTWLIAAAGLDRREDRLWALHGRSENLRELIWNSIGSYREAHRLAPYDPEVAVLLGRALLENKLYEEAEKVLSEASTYAPNFYDVWEPLAACYFFQNKHAEAEKAYDWMIFFNVNAENAYVNKAAAQGSHGRLPDALLTLQTALRRFPENPKIYMNLAITYLKLGMRAEARAALKNAERLGPSDPQVDQLKKVLR